MEIGWRQKTLSAKTALNESLISLIISGRVVPSTAEMEAIATALSCDPAELFDGLLR
jgi:transcriptional regulator with XRE-family HTH domain